MTTYLVIKEMFMPNDVPISNLLLMTTDKKIATSSADKAGAIIIAIEQGERDEESKSTRSLC